MSNNNAYHRESLASISQRRLSTVKSKSIYVLPNAFTAAALFSAFYGIIAAMNGDFYVLCSDAACLIGVDELSGKSGCCDC